MLKVRHRTERQKGFYHTLLIHGRYGILCCWIREKLCVGCWGKSLIATRGSKEGEAAMSGKGQKKAQEVWSGLRAKFLVLCHIKAYASGR